MKNGFLASGTHFLLFSWIIVNCCQWKQFILQLEHIFQPILYLGQWNRQYCFIPSFFCQWKLLLKLGVSQFLKTKYIPASEHKFFRYFQRLYDLKQLFRIVETHFSTNPLSGQWKRIFCLVETVFFDQSQFSASGSHYWNQEKTVFKQRVYYC